MEGDEQNMTDMEMGHHDHHWSASQLVVTVIVIVVLLALGFWLYSYVGTTPTDDSGEVETGLNEGEELTVAPEGEVIPGFPNDLLLEEGVTVSESYSIAYRSQGTSQPVVEYSSALTLEENIDMFGTYFVENGWEVTNEADVNDIPVTFFYAEKDNADVNVTFTQDEGGAVMVSIAYTEALQP